MITQVLNTSGSVTATRTQFVLKDHLGSVNVITDGAGKITDLLAFDPWGKRRAESIGRRSQYPRLSPPGLLAPNLKPAEVLPAIKWRMKWKSSIWVAFIRLTDHTNAQTRGLGLGLAIVSKIMQWHGGRAFADTSPGSGARVLLEWFDAGIVQS